MRVRMSLTRGQVEEIDSRLVTLGRGLGAMRLRVGEGLVRLERSGGVRALGFPNLGSYALEALGRSGRWAADVRALARRLEGLPHVRAELMSGRLASSMVELVARVADPDDEVEWIERARTMTVRDMRVELKRRRMETIDDDAPNRVSVTARVDRVDAWAFERARIMVQTVGARRGDQVIEAMLAEGLSEIIAQHPGIDLPRPLMEDFEHESRQRLAELALIHEDAEAAVDSMLPKAPLPPAPAADEIEWPAELVEIDTLLRSLAKELATRDLELARWGEMADVHGVWDRLVYRSFDHYCRDRIGVSPSSMSARLALRRRLAELPEVAAALEEGRVGFEAARVISRVARAETASGWIARAAGRTVKQLREEVDAVEMVARVEDRDVRQVSPPSAEVIADVRGVERAVIAVVGGLPIEDDAGVELEGQMSGRVTLRIGMSAELGRFWRVLERVHAGLEREESFVAFLVGAVVRSWTGSVAGRVAYWDVYLRDRWRCASPVCSSRNMTPHHVRFRSRGGGEERSNLISLCEVCHLELVHGSRLKVAGSAPDGLRWSALGWSA